MSLPTEPEPLRAHASLASASTLRAVALAVFTVSALGTSAVVARTLGADGKGLVSSLGYLATLGSVVAGLGLGEAAIALAGRDPRVLQVAYSATVVVTAMAAMVVTPAVLLAGWALFPEPSHRAAVVVAALIVPFATFTTTIGFLVEAEHRIGRNSIAKAAVALATMIATFVLVRVVHLGEAGAIAAVGAGWMTGLVTLISGGQRPHRLPRSEVVNHLRQALGLGIPMLLAALLLAAAGRIDLIVVQATKGDAHAGRYSISLTIAALAYYAPIAMSSASFPRLAGLAARERDEFLAKMVRTSTVLAIVGAIGLAVVVPSAIPLAFGDDFRPAVVPTLIALVGSVPASIQLVLARGMAAGQRTRALVVSYAVAVGTMLALDVMIVPAFGVVGAAIASDLSAVAGAAVALRFYAIDGGSIAALAPRPTDVTLILSRLRGGRDGR